MWGMVIVLVMLTGCATAGAGVIAPGLPSNASGRVGLDATCAGWECRYEGRCVAREGECWVAATTDDDCRRPHGENEDVPCDGGQCTATDGVCVAGSDADCQQSGSCLWSGDCKAARGRCRVPATTDEACRRPRGRLGIVPCDFDGACVARAGICRADSDAACGRSTVCQLFGLCRARNGTCVVGSDADCRKSEACVEAGACFAGYAGCVAFSDADCERSRECEDRGACVARDGTCWGPAGTDLPSRQ